MEQFKIIGTRMHKGEELTLNGIIELITPGFFYGEIYGSKGDKSLPIQGSIHNYDSSMFETDEAKDMTVLSFRIPRLCDGDVWHSPIHYNLKKPKSLDDKGTIIQDKLVPSIPETAFIAGDYSGNWYQSIMVYDGPNSRAKGKPLSGAGGGGIVKIVLERLV